MKHLFSAGKITLFLIFFSLLAAPFALTVAAQNATVKVTVSKKKKVIDRKTYYLHTVKQGENLFAIANAYGVLQKDIVAANPNAFIGIRIGEVLNIPAQSGAASSYEGKGLESDRFIFHIAAEGQKKEDISALYHITLDSLYLLNPELEYASMDPGQVVIIPKTHAENALAVETASTLTHRVASQETVFSISRQYGITTNELLEANPSVNPSTLRIRSGQTLNIPQKQVQPVISIPMVYQQTDTIVIRKDTLTQVENVLEKAILSSSDAIRIALLLPLFLEENPFESATASPYGNTMGSSMMSTPSPWGTFATNNTPTYTLPDSSLYPRSLNFLEFYQGALVALHEMQQKGAKIEVYTYDTGRDLQKLNQILMQPELSQMDLLVGPFYSEMLSQINAFARQHQIYFVSPLTENQNLLQHNPYMLQFFPNPEKENATLLAYLQKQTPAHVIFVRNAAENLSEEDQAFMQKVKQSYPDSCYSILSMNPDERDIFKYQIFRPDQRYIFVTTSQNEVFASNLMAQLNVLSQEQNIQLCGPFAWTRFVNIDLEYFHTLNYRYAAPFYIDHQQPAVQTFLSQYDQMFQTEPYEILTKGYNYAFLGYDILSYFGHVLQLYGKSFGSDLENKITYLLQSDVSFEKTDSDSGLLNQAYRLMVYTTDYFMRQENQ